MAINSTILHDISPSDLKELIRDVIREEQSVTPIPENGQDLLTIKETKTKLRISDPTLLKLERQGKLSSVRIGAKKFYRQQDIIKFLESQEG